MRRFDFPAQCKKRPTPSEGGNPTQTLPGRVIWLESHWNSTGEGTPTEREIDRAAGRVQRIAHGGVLLDGERLVLGHTQGPRHGKRECTWVGVLGRRREEPLKLGWVGSGPICPFDVLVHVCCPSVFLFPSWPPLSPCHGLRRSWPRPAHRPPPPHAALWHKTQIVCSLLTMWLVGAKPPSQVFQHSSAAAAASLCPGHTSGGTKQLSSFT